MDLRHRHGDAASDARDREQDLQRVRLQGDRTGREGVTGDPAGLGQRPLRATAQDPSEGQDQADACQPDRDQRLAPPDRADEMLDDRRPKRAREVIAGRDERDRDAAPALEPERDVGHERPEARRAAEADEAALRERESDEVRREAGQDEARPEEDRAQSGDPRDAESVGRPPHHHASDPDGDHQARIGKRRGAPVGAKLGLHRRQDDDNGPHAGAADGGHRQGDREPHPGGAAIRREGGRAADARRCTSRRAGSLCHLDPPDHPFGSTATRAGSASARVAIGGAAMTFLPDRGGAFFDAEPGSRIRCRTVRAPLGPG